ncbi:MAG: hypothetical protein R3232_06600, partial [Clostridia bacterium]|nr:hypothetical protein [Clostridia bacterium]
MGFENMLQEKKDWSASWIWHPEAKGPNNWVLFEKQFDLEAEIKNASAYISTETKYLLVINGKTIVREGGLNRGPLPDAGYYDEVDITEHLIRGLNTIRVLVWYWGNQGRNNVDSGHGGLLFQAEIDKTVIKSDGTWDCMIHPSFEETSDPMPSYLYGGHNIGYDSRCSESLFECNGERVSATELGDYPVLPWGKLYRRPIPLFRTYDESNYNSISYEETNGAVTAEAVLPYACQMSPCFEIMSSSGGVIDIRSDRYEVNGGNGDEKNTYRGHRIEYITKAGYQEFKAPTWLFGEKVMYKFTSGTEVLSLKFIESGYDCDFEGAFSTNESWTAGLFKKSRRTLYACMRDNYMDCPDRERGQWIGDVSSQVPQVFYMLGRSADKLTQKSITDFINWRDGDILRGNIPGAHCGELPSQSLNAIGMHGMIVSYYMHTGDRSILGPVYEPMQNYLQLWKIK